MKKNIILQFALEQELMDEILMNDYKSKYRICSESNQTTYTYDKVLKRDENIINDNGMLYLNDKIALNLLGTIQEENVIYKTADLEIIPGESIVKKGGIIIRIWPRTYYILLAFMRSPNGFVSRKTLNGILESKSKRMIQDNTLNQHMNRLRKALGTYHGEQYFKTSYEMGYRWNHEIIRVKKD